MFALLLWITTTTGSTQAESNTVHSSEEDQSEADQQVLSGIVSESDLLLNVHYDVKGAGSYDVMNSMVMKSSSTGTADEQLVHARNTALLKLPATQEHQKAEHSLSGIKSARTLKTSSDNSSTLPITENASRHIDNEFPPTILISSNCVYRQQEMT
eukprot:15276-Heterococcus_DN1.PRE.4